MITTRESINYQFSLIFGYSSPKDLIVGNVLGPGKLTREKVNELSYDVIRFLRMYNAILRDYTGSELYYVEFELFNFDEKDAKIKIYPKSMLLVPGKYKECESLLLGLKPDTGYLDIHKSRASLDNISKLFFEVEEFTNHPDLNNDDKCNFLGSFAVRFSKKLYGELIEDKWNKKLIGITTSLPTDKEMLTQYGSIRNDLKIFWNRKPIEYNFLNYEYGRFSTPFSDKMAIEHLKYLISEPSARVLVEHTLKLGTSLLKLANTGTMDETQERILVYLIKMLKEDLVLRDVECPTGELFSYSEDFLVNMEKNLNQFSEIAEKFLSSGEKGELTKLLELFELFIQSESNLNSRDRFREIFNLCKFSLFQSVSREQDLIAIELSSALNYFFELFKQCFTIIRRALPRFLYRRELILLANLLIKNVKAKLEREQKPAKALGGNLISKFELTLKSRIEFSSRVLSKNYSFDRNSLIKNFKKIVIETFSHFFKNIELDISDLISFAEVQMENNPELIKRHLDKFERFSKELTFMANYILRYSTINRFLKDENAFEVADPVTFANKFYRFLEKRVAGIDLEWKGYVLEWIKDYAKKFFDVTEKRDWRLNETFTDFIEYFEQREKLEQDIKHFFSFLDKYIAQVVDENEKHLLLDFYKQFEYSLDIKFEFPIYVQKTIETELNLINFDEIRTSPINFLSISEDDTIYDYIRENEVKYFSKLIPRPKSIILRHDFSNEEKESFIGNLFHVIHFKYWHNKSNYVISDNFKEVYREWIKEL
ncbi:MAG: hypothetical protein ACFE8E_02015 [Candidatus Hodarchaeota archaeon]